MNANLLAFITSQCDKGLVGRGRESFLLDLRGKSEIVVEWVRSYLMDWMSDFGPEPFVRLCYNEADSRVVVEHFKKYFATEIRALPPSVTSVPVSA